MFRSELRRRLERLMDVLAAAPGAAELPDAPAERPVPTSHPHHRPLRRRARRRAGAVPPRAAVCLSPVPGAPAPAMERMRVPRGIERADRVDGPGRAGA